MKQVRLFIVAALVMASVCSLAAEPMDEALWTRDFFWSKVIAFAIGAVAYKLFKYWDSKGLLPKDKFKDVKM